MTVLQAVAMAEGPTPTASLGRTIIIRQSQSESDRVEIPIDGAMRQGKDSGPNTFCLFLSLKACAAEHW